MIVKFVSDALNDITQDFHWSDVVLIVLVGLIIIGSGIGLRDPWPADEPRFAAIARDMVVSGEWFFPRIGGVYYPDKPPVFFWLIAIFYKLSGSLRIAFLLPSLFASLGVLLLVQDLGRRLWNRSVGLGASIILLFAIQFTSSAKLAQIDMLLCFWVTLSIYALARHLLIAQNWPLYYCGFIAAGLGVITKGVGFLPLLIFIPFIISSYFGWNQLQHKWSWKWLLGPLLFFMVIALWLGPMLLLVQNSLDPALEAYRDNILFKQTGGRYLRAWDHHEPFWFYFTNVIPMMWLPLSLALPWVFPKWLRAIRARDQRIFILLTWAVCVVLFFSFAKGKRGVYLLSILPVMALLTAPYLRELIQNIWIKRCLFLSLLLVGIIILAVYLFLTVIEPDKGASLVLQHQITPWPYLLSIGVIVLAIAALSKVQNSHLGWLGFLTCFWLIYSFWVYSNITDVRSGANFVQSVEQHLEPNQELALIAWKEQFLLEFNRPVRHFGFRRFKERRIAISKTLATLPVILEAASWLTQKHNRVVLIPEILTKVCFIDILDKKTGFSNREAWYLLTYQNVNPVCLMDRPKIDALLYDSRLGKLVN